MVYAPPLLSVEASERQAPLLRRRAVNRSPGENLFERMKSSPGRLSERTKICEGFIVFRFGWRQCLSNFVLENGMDRVEAEKTLFRKMKPSDSEWSAGHLLFRILIDDMKAGEGVR